MVRLHPLEIDPTTIVCGDHGEALLLLHGGGSDPLSDFGPVLNGLASRHRLAATHLPGAGPAPRQPGQLELDDLVDLQIAAADRAGFDSFAVVAFSLGCPIAVRLATRYPDRIRALVLLAGFATPDARLQLLVRIWRHLLLTGERERMADFVLSATVDEEALDRLDDAELALRQGVLASRLPDCLDEYLELIPRIDVRPDLPQVAAPTLVVAGAHDRLATPRHSRTLADGIPGATYREVACGHALVTERPAALLELLTDFLSG